MNTFKAVGLMVLSLVGALSTYAQVAAPGSTLSRDIYHDSWFPEWNTLGGAAGYRNTAVDPNPPDFELRDKGKTLHVVKAIGAMGEDNWDRGAILVFGWDGTDYVRFGMWQTPGGGAMYATVQAVDFTIPNWVQGKIVWEYWAWYGAKSNITNYFYDPSNGTWINKLQKSHLAVGSGETGIDLDVLKPKSPVLKQNQSIPTGVLSASASEIELGGSVTLTVAASDNDVAATTLVGGGLNINNPTGSVVVTPSTVGLQTFTLTVRGYNKLTWDTPEAGDTLTLITPAGVSIPLLTYTYFQARASNSGFGKYQLIETNVAGFDSVPFEAQVDEPAPYVVTVSVNVSAPPAGSAALAVVPNQRCWTEGSSYKAYLARHDIILHATGNVQAPETITGLELQVKNPQAADWQPIGNPVAVASAPTADVTIATMMDDVVGGPTDPKNLVPRNASLVGSWQYRARLILASGKSIYSSPLPIEAVLPVKVQTVTARTLPPVGEELWYTSSDAKTFTFNVLIP